MFDRDARIAAYELVHPDGSDQEMAELIRVRVGACPGAQSERLTRALHGLPDHRTVEGFQRDVGHAVLLLGISPPTLCAQTEMASDAAAALLHREGARLFYESLTWARAQARQIA